MDQRKDLAFAVAVAVLGGMIVVLSFDISLGRVRDPIGARFVPLVTGSFIFLVGLGLAIRRWLRWQRGDHWVDGEGAPQDQAGIPGSTIRAMAVWGICLAYVLVLPQAGFLIVTPMLVAALLWVMGIHRLLRVVMLSLTTAGLMYWVLGVLLNVRLPLGPLQAYLS